jgi:hypothetical protein
LATVHFIKDNRELSSIGIDEHTQIEVLEGSAPASPAVATSSPGRSVESNAPT